MITNLDKTREKEYHREYRKIHREELRQKARKYRRTPAGKAARQRYDATEKRAAVNSRSLQKWRLANPGKRRRSEGKFRLTCYFCGAPFRSRFHKEFCSRLCRNAAKRELHLHHHLQRAFLNKIWQPCICSDCGVAFETLYPVEWVALGIKNRCGVKRCPVHLRVWRTFRHGGDSRRCLKFGVSYDPNVNRGVIFEQDNWRCYRCGIATPKEKRGLNLSDSPEIDHVWALGEVRDGVKSPGHVQSNLRCICRKCNVEKNKEVKWRSHGAHDAFYKEQLNGWLNKKEFSFICAWCKQAANKTRPNARYCSGKCSDAAELDGKRLKCGKTQYEVLSSALTAASNFKIGKEKEKRGPKISSVGKVFGRLTILKICDHRWFPSSGKFGKIRYLCQCVCGAQHVLNISAIHKYRKDKGRCCSRKQSSPPLNESL